ncbi:MAG: hypothetical protein ACEPOW_14525 [Bacteroidales bacterium]
MNYNLTKEEQREVFNNSEEALLRGNKVKFDFNRNWSSNFPNRSGVYAVYEINELLYIGETANLKERMKEIKRTYNHAFRKKLGEIRFNGIIEKQGKYSEKIESQMNEFYREKLYISFIEVNFGRIEIESHLIEKYQDRILNSESKRTKTTK